jgi:hypothetical protein
VVERFYLVKAFKTFKSVWTFRFKAEVKLGTIAMRMHTHFKVCAANKVSKEVLPAEKIIGSAAWICNLLNDRVNLTFQKSVKLAAECFFMIELSNLPDPLILDQLCVFQLPNIVAFKTME